MNCERFVLRNNEKGRSDHKAVRIGEVDYTPLKSGEADYGPSSTEGGGRDGGKCGIGEVGFALTLFFLIPRIINPASKRGV